MGKFELELDKLNKQQRQAVEAIEGPVLVVAGPGTGKTQLLSMRVANILKQTDTEAGSILCLTFTNKAATNMRERLNQLIGPESRFVQVKTFHSFAADIMNQYPDYFWEGARLSVAPDAVIDDIIQSILARLPSDNPMASTFAGSYTALKDVKKGLELAKKAGLTPEELRKAINGNLQYIDKIEPMMISALDPVLSTKKLDELHDNIYKLPEQPDNHQSVTKPLEKVIKQGLDQAIDQDDGTSKTTYTGKWKKQWIQTVDGVKAMHKERQRNQWWLDLCDIYEQYRDYLHQRLFYDYSDMLIEVLQQLKSNSDMLADLQERFLYVLIDEFQDTNAAQLRLARQISDHHSSNNQPNLMAVGDDDQSIFAFNGAELSNMLEFREKYPSTRVITLTDNYRSQQPILDFSKDIIEQAEDRLIKRDSTLSKDLQAKASSKQPAKASHQIYPTRLQQYSELAQSIKKQWYDGNKDIAVLARSHDSLKQLASILSTHDIPVRYEQKSNVLEHEVVRLIYQIASTAVAIGSGDIKTVNHGLSQILRHPMWQISDETLWKLALDNYKNYDWYASLLDSKDEQLNKIGSWFAWLARNSGSMPLPLTLEHILGLSHSEQFVSPLRDYFLKNHDVSSEYLETLSAISLLRGLADEFSQEEPKLTDFVHFVELNLSTKRVIADESWFVSGEQAVHLLTIHKAKGLEFDHVYLIDAMEDSWKPVSRGRKSPANLRLQSYGENYDDYVRLLYVAATRAKNNFTATSYSSNDKGEEQLATPILSITAPMIVDTDLIEPTTTLEEGIRWPRLSSKNEKTLLADKLENFELSPSSLIDFLNVAESGPKEFLERHILRLPTPGSVAGSFGTSIHAALETAQRLVNEGHLTVDTVLDRYESALKKEHLLPADYERLLTRGEDLLTNLIKDNSLNLKKGGKTEQKINRILLENARIKGTIDLLDKDETSVTVTDYKTGKPLVSFDTKDKTKMVKAWRHKTQLLFYALLVTESGRYKTKSVKTQMAYLETENINKVKLEYTPNQEDINKLSRLIKAVWEHIINLDFPDVSQYSKDYDGIAAFEKDLLK